MPKEWSHVMRNARRRGNPLPGGPRIGFRRGVTLVELMISMLILAIVCMAWLEIIGIQSARRESRRREAVERLSGMMDAFLYRYRSGAPSAGGYHMVMNMDIGSLSFEADGGTNVVHSVFDSGVSPVGYRLCVVKAKDLPNSAGYVNWDDRKWLVGYLYDTNGALSDVGRPFCVLPVYIGP